MSWGTVLCHLCQWMGLVWYVCFGGVVLLGPEACREELLENYQIGTACEPSVSNMDL